MLVRPSPGFGAGDCVGCYRKEPWTSHAIVSRIAGLGMPITAVRQCLKERERYHIAHEYTQEALDLVLGAAEVAASMGLTNVQLDQMIKQLRADLQVEK